MMGSVPLSLDNFDAFGASHDIEEFVSDLSLWYVRRSRDRVGPTAANSQDKLACHFTLYYLLTTISQLLAPFTPFISEEIYKNLTGKESVHLSDWPKAAKLSKSDVQLIKDMKFVRKIVEMGLSQRKTAGIKVRQPLRTLRVNAQCSILNIQLLQLIKDELNVKEIEWIDNKELSVSLDLDLDSELIAEGKVRELIRQVQELRKEKGARLDQKIKLVVPELPVIHELFKKLKLQTLAKEVKEGDELWIELT